MERTNQPVSPGSVCDLCRVFATKNAGFRLCQALMREIVMSSRWQQSFGYRRQVLRWRRLQGARDVEKYALVVVIQVRQVVREVGKVIAQAELQVIAEVARNRGQCTGAMLA